jgi:hypothetical protein
MKEIKNIKNKVVKLGGPGSGPNPGDTRGSYNTKGGSKEKKDDFEKRIKAKDDAIEKKAQDIVAGKAEPDMSTQEGRLAAARASRMRDNALNQKEEKMLINGKEERLTAKLKTEIADAAGTNPKVRTKRQRLLIDSFYKSTHPDWEKP